MAHSSTENRLGLTALSDWDVLTFGGVGDILVRIDDDSESRTPLRLKHAGACAPLRSRSPPEISLG